jgi:hypothetical protein
MPLGGGIKQAEHMLVGRRSQEFDQSFSFDAPFEKALQESTFHFELELRLQIQGPHLGEDELEGLEHRCLGSRAWLAEENMNLKKQFAKHLKF